MTEYIPRIISPSVDSAGDPVQPAWDPYPQYILDYQILDSFGKIHNELLPDMQAYVDSSTLIQSAVTKADAAQADSSLALTKATEALNTATTTGTQAATDAAAAQTAATNAQNSAAQAEVDAQAALDMGTSAVSTAVEDYLTNTGTLTDVDGQLAQWRRPKAQGRVLTTGATITNTMYGISILNATDFQFNMAAASTHRPWERYTLKNVNPAAITVALAAGDSVNGTLNGTVPLASGQVVTLVSDGATNWYTV